jgi:hypothetical protein
MIAQLLELVGKFLLAAANTVAALMVVIDIIRRRSTPTSIGSY